MVQTPESLINKYYYVGAITDIAARKALKQPHDVKSVQADLAKFKTDDLTADNFAVHLENDIRNQAGLKVKAGKKIESLASKYDRFPRKGLTIVSQFDPRQSVQNYLQAVGAKQLVFDRGVNAGGLDPVMSLTLYDDPNSLTKSVLEAGRQNKEIAASPYTIGINRFAQQHQSNPVEVAEARLGEINQMATSYQNAKANDQAQQIQRAAATQKVAQQTANQQFSKQPQAGEKTDDEQLTGIAQLTEAFAPYVSEADLKALNGQIDEGYHFDPAILKTSQEILAHLNDIGVDFNLKARNRNFSGEKNVVEARINDASHTSIRVLTDDKRQLGHVYMGEGNFYYTNSAAMRMGNDGNYHKDPNWIPPVPYAAMDFVLGRKSATIAYGRQRAVDPNDPTKETYKPTSGQLRIDGDSRNKVYFKPSRNFERLNAVMTDLTEEQADAQLEQYVSTARNEYFAALAGPDLAEVDFGLAADQKDLNDWLNSQEFEDAEATRQAASDYLVKQALGEELPEYDELPEGTLSTVDHMNDLADSYVGHVDTKQVPGSIDEPAHEVLHEMDLNHVAQLTSRVAETATNDNLINVYKQSSWSRDNLIGVDYAVERSREQLVQFDAGSARGIDQAKSPAEKQLLEHLQDELKNGFKVSNSKGQGNPTVQIDDNGIIKWSGDRRLGIKKRSIQYAPVSGEIGQVFLPDEHGIMHTKFNNDSNYDMIPGIKGYFKFEGVDKDVPRMERLRGEGFEQSLYANIDSALRRQVLRPVSGNVSGPTDTTMLNNMYRGQLYGMRLKENWYEETKLPTDVKDAIVQTYANRVHFNNKYGEFATSFSEDAGDEMSEVSKVVDGKNMRILDDDYEGVFDMTMTGTNKTQGMVLYMGQEAKLNHDGTFEPARDRGGNIKDTNAPVRNLDEFKYSKYNAWDRNQMASNQILTALDVAHDTRAMLSTFGGWTFDDSAVISKEFAESHMVEAAHPGIKEQQFLEDKLDAYEADPSSVDFSKLPWDQEDFEGVLNTDADTRESFVDHQGIYRPLMKGDKISDFGGNKATIGLVVDRDMDQDQAYAQGLSNEVDIFNQNRDLDLVMSPYSVVTRDNAGVVKELADSEVEDVSFVDQQGRTHEIGQSGTLNVIVTDLTVDTKTHAYTAADIRDGKGRKASGQLGWAANQMGLDATVKELWGDNESTYAAYREYLMVAGYDMAADGTLQKGYHPHENEERQTFELDAGKNGDDFVRELGTKGGMLQLPFKVNTGVFDENQNPIMTDQIPVMSAGLRRNRELISGQTQIDDFTQDYAKIYTAASNYLAEDQDDGAKAKSQEQAVRDTQAAFTGLQTKVINNKLGGVEGEFSKHSYMRDKMMTKRLDHSATAVQTADPRLSVGTIGMSQDVSDSLARKRESDKVIMWRDPCLRGEAMTAMNAHVDKSLTGISTNPLIAGKYDGDYDGDSLGLASVQGRAAQKELDEKLSLGANTMDAGSGDKDSIINASMDFVSSGLQAGILKPTNEDKEGRTPKQQLNDKLLKIHRTADSADDEISQIDNLVKKSLRVPEAYGSAQIRLKDREDTKASIEEIVNSSAKGKPQSVDEFLDYFDGKKTRKDAQEIQRASGYKSDLTGVAGSFSQKMMAAMRNTDPKMALEVTYPNTQGVLQVKHDADKAVVISEALMKDEKNLFAGKSIYDKPTDKPGHVSKSQFKTEFMQVYNNKLGIDIDGSYVDKLSDALADKSGMIEPLAQKMQEVGSPMDQIAYGGGLKAVDRLASEGRSLREGENTQKFVPETIVQQGLQADVKDKLVKKDTQVEQTVEPEPVAGEKAATVINSDYADNLEKLRQQEKQANQPSAETQAAVDQALGLTAQKTASSTETSHKPKEISADEVTFG